MARQIDIVKKIQNFIPKKEEKPPAVVRPPIQIKAVYYRRPEYKNVKKEKNHIFLFVTTLILVILVFIFLLIYGRAKGFIESFSWSAKHSSNFNQTMNPNIKTEIINK